MRRAAACRTSSRIKVDAIADHRAVFDLRQHAAAHLRGLQQLAVSDSDGRPDSCPDENLLPAAKNIGVTHITNGCYRMHPVEWNVGEAAGALVAYCQMKAVCPRQVRNTPKYLHDFQRMLENELGVVLAGRTRERLFVNAGFSIGP